MNKIAMSILELERNKARNQIGRLNRKIGLLEKFMSDYPNAEISEVQIFISFVEHTDFAYETIIEKMKKNT